VFIAVAVVFVGLPLLSILLLLPFFGERAVGLVLIVYFHLLVAPVIDRVELNNTIDWQSVIERQSNDFCAVTVYALREDAQPTPFAQSPEDKDWQPRVGGLEEDQPRGDEGWSHTPVTDHVASLISDDMTYSCEASAATVAMVETVMTTPGSWYAFHSRGVHKHYLYSASKGIAVVFTNDF